jgi:glycosyltransferase involved in cell wall biosynthesis
MQKPRLFVNMHYMELGGAERALLGLLNAIDTSKVDVDLFLNQHTGDFMPQIPSKINLLPEIPAYSAIERSMKTVLREGHWGVICGRIIGRIKYKRYLRSVGKRRDGSATQYVFDGVSPFLPSLKYLGHYDLAISFLDPPHIVQDKVDASLRMEWIHTDWTTVEVNEKLVEPRWRRNDFIVSISEAVTVQFLKRFPQFKDKIIEIHNILSPAFVRSQALLEEGMSEFNPEGVTLCSVGRIAYLKNFDNIPHIAKIMKDRGLKFHWFVVGPGNHESIDMTIHYNRVEDCVHFVGPKTNPYPWMNACDIYVQPSRYEGHSVTVREAQILCKPVVITAYPTASSQIRNGVDGVICGMKNESIAEAILSLISDQQKQQDLTSYLTTHDYGNEREVEKLYQILNIA